MSNRNTASLLLPYWTPTVERVGLVLFDGTVIELRNQSPTPETGFMVDPEEFKSVSEYTVGMWHTHPKNNVNLSPLDHNTFKSLAGWTHYIVTETRVRSFIVRNNKVMLHEADCI